MAIEDAFELVKQLATIRAETVPVLLRQFEASCCDRITRVFTTISPSRSNWAGRASNRLFHPKLEL